MRPSVLPLLLASTLLVACATTSREGRTQFLAHPTLSTAYSDFDMHVRLASATEAAADSAAGCAGAQCETTQEFELRVLLLGTPLAASAYRRFPELRQRGGKFDFAVARKAETGTLSNADGAVVVLDGVRRLGLSDELLSFVIAREMGHVVARHHDEDSATSIIVSVVTAVLLPVTSLFRGAAAFLSSGVASSATTAAASLAGSSVVRASYRADQVREADAIAMQLLGDQGSELHDLTAALGAGEARFGDDEWSADLRSSFRRVEQLAWGPPHRLRGMQAQETAAFKPAQVQ